jgi:hypothetical protein
VGVPLSNGTHGIAVLLGLPVEAGTAQMFSTCTENDRTLAKGASVPTTNAGPVSTAGFVPLELVSALVQPAISNAAADNETNAIGKDFTNVLESITIKPLCSRVFSCFLVYEHRAGLLIGLSTRKQPKRQIGEDSHQAQI